MKRTEPTEKLLYTHWQGIEIENRARSYICFTSMQRYAIFFGQSDDTKKKHSGESLFKTLAQKYFSAYFFLAMKKNEGVKISNFPPSQRSMAVALSNAETSVDPAGATPIVSRQNTIV